MQPLNPFLSAFSKSPILAQCLPPQQHILLVPTADVLLSLRDAETGAPLVASIASDEFLASHVVRIPIPKPAAGGRDAAQNLREMRGKPRVYSTFNGRSLVIKDNAIYTNKGMPSLGLGMPPPRARRPLTSAVPRLQIAGPGQPAPRCRLVPRHA